MRKIELDLDGLTVESFRVDGDNGQARGTVVANENTLNENCYTQVGSCYRTACCPETTLC